MGKTTNQKTFKFMVDEYTTGEKTQIIKQSKFRTCQELMESYTITKSAIYFLINNKYVRKHDTLNIFRICEPALVTSLAPSVTYAI
tara:strand:+ start:283 stop:540 length:258 start_codon:yes stop_codon:yes gene_type:complete